MKKLYPWVFIAVFMTITYSAYSQTTKEFSRKGFVFGTSVGGGLHQSETRTYARFSIPNFKLGAMVNAKLAVLVYTPGGISKREGETRAFEGFLATGQYWLTDNLYVNAGMGIVLETTPFYQVDYSAGPPEFNSGVGYAVSTGREIVQWSHNKKIDVQLRFLYGNIRYQDDSRRQNYSVDFLIGFNFY